MAMDKEELEELNQMIRMLVFFYKTIWSEVKTQFSELPTEEKHKIYGVIAPSIVGMFNMTSDDSNADETRSKPRNRRRKKTMKRLP
jgi:hypothetical protein